MKRKKNRRKFLKKTVALSTAAAASLIIPKKSIAKKKYNWKMVTTWPKNFPGLGSAAETFEKMVNECSGGKMNITVFGAGEIVPAFEAMDAVSSGAIEMGHGGPYYWKGKVTAAQYLSAIPFGLTPQEQNSWFEKGGGQEIADEIYKKMGCKFFVCGNTGPQMGGWYNKEIKKIEDYQGLKMRAPGLGGEVDKVWFQDQFKIDKEKKIFDKNKNLVSITVNKKKNTDGKVHEVDGITGATVTSDGVTKFLRRDLERYKNFLVRSR